MSVLISILNHVPTSIAAHFQADGIIGRSLRAMISRTSPVGDVVAVVRAGHGRGIRLLLDPTREKYYWAGQHDVPVQESLVRTLRPGATFWDVGAHIGFFSILAARIVGSTGHVHSFEPQPANRTRLEAATKLNHVDNVMVHDIAVGGLDGSALLHGHSESAMWTLVADRGDPDGIEVATRTIDSLAAEFGDPSVIKIDVEGAELDVLRGALELIDRSHPALIVEFAVPEFAAAARGLLPSYRFEQVSDLDWLLFTLEEPDAQGR